MGLVLLLLAGRADAECNDEIRSPQKPRDVARLKWTAAGRTWEVALSWLTESVSDDGQEEATAGVGAWNDRRLRTKGESRIFDLTPNRCDLGIDPSLSTVKLMGRDFLLVTLPDGGTSGSVVLAWMYSIDETGHLTQVFHSAYRSQYIRTPQCRYQLRSYIRPENADGSRFSWVYEAPGREWVRKKSECAKSKTRQVAFIYEWKNGCFPAVEQPNRNLGRLITDWDEEECLMGKGLVTKATPPDGGTPPAGQPGTTVKGEKP